MRDIDERNLAFRTKIKRKVDAAIKIQRAFKRWNRFRKFGLKTWEIDQDDLTQPENTYESPRKVAQASPSDSDNLN